MRLDPKYFNRFIGICAAVTAVVIVYSTVRYFQNQITSFENDVSELRADTLRFQSYSSQDSLFIRDLPDQPVIIHFWGTWSDKSQEVGDFLKSYSADQNELIVIAASVRDADESVENFLNENSYSFHFVKGNDLYESVEAPGMPSQIFLDRRKQIFDTHVGNDTTEIKIRLEQLLNSE